MSYFYILILINGVYRNVIEGILNKYYNKS